MNRKPLKRIINAGLSDIRMTEQKKNDILRNIRGEEVMKKKISFSLILALIIMLVAAVSIAASIVWENYAVQVKQTENAQGTYSHWNIDDKIDLIRILVDNGHIASSDTTMRLFGADIPEEDAHQIADQLMLELTQAEEVKDINLDVITYAIMGFFETWTPEQRVWWQQITNMYRDPDIIESDTFVSPTSEDLSEAEAIEIARNAVILAYDLPEDYFTHNSSVVADLYITEQRPDYRRWSIMLNVYREGSSNYLERAYVVIVDDAGNVISDPDVGVTRPGDEHHDDVPRRPTTEPFATIDAFALRVNDSPFRTWPLALKAEYSGTVAPMVRGIIESGDLTPLINGEGPDLSVIASTTFTYGIPGEMDMAQDRALDLARQTVMASYDLDTDTMALYDDISVYFDITNPEIPLWKFVLIPTVRDAFAGGYDSDQAWLQYKVEIASRTGEVTKAETFTLQISGNDLDYELNWY